MPDTAEQKKILRRRNFRAVKGMTEQEKAAASVSICEQIAGLPPFRSAETVFAYLPLNSEPDLTSLFVDSKTWGFSRVLSDQSMEFCQVENFKTDLTEGDFKIMEPDAAVCPVIDSALADVILIPGVGFSKDTGNRLGRGKGHYDRYLEKVLRNERAPTLIGVCFGIQLCEVKSEPHDIPMDTVVFG